MDRRARGCVRALAVAGAIGAVAGCGAGTDGAPDAGAATAPASTGPATTAPATTAPVPPVGDGPRIITRRLGKAGRDGTLTFRVRRLAVSPPIRIPFGRPLRAPAGRRLLVAAVEVRNHARVAADPFCGGGGALLVDRGGRAHEPHRRVYAIPRNRTCYGIAPGRRSIERLAFVVPAGTRPAAIRLWDAAQPGDVLGRGHVRVVP